MPSSGKSRSRGLRQHGRDRQQLAREVDFRDQREIGREARGAESERTNEKRPPDRLDGEPSELNRRDAASGHRGIGGLDHRAGKHHDEGREDRPQHAQYGLLVPDAEVTRGQLKQQFAIAEHVTSDIRQHLPRVDSRLVTLTRWT